MTEQEVPAPAPDDEPINDIPGTPEPETPPEEGPADPAFEEGED